MDRESSGYSFSSSNQAGKWEKKRRMGIENLVATPNDAFAACPSVSSFGYSNVLGVNRLMIETLYSLLCNYFIKPPRELPDHLMVLGFRGVCINGFEIPRHEFCVEAILFWIWKIDCSDLCSSSCFVAS